MPRDETGKTAPPNSKKRWRPRMPVRLPETRDPQGSSWRRAEPCWTRKRFTHVPVILKVLLREPGAAIEANTQVSGQLINELPRQKSLAAAKKDLFGGQGEDRTLQQPKKIKTNQPSQESLSDRVDRRVDPAVERRKNVKIDMTAGSCLPAGCSYDKEYFGLNNTPVEEARRPRSAGD